MLDLKKEYEKTPCVLTFGQWLHEKCKELRKENEFLKGSLSSWHYSLHLYFDYLDRNQVTTVFREKLVAILKEHDLVFDEFNIGE